MLSSSFQAQMNGDDWAVIDANRSDQLATANQHYLQTLLETYATGSRVVDLDCGVGSRAIALAKVGFAVTGFSASAWAISEASRHARQAGVNVKWAVVDVRTAYRWPLAEADMAVCADDFGRGSDPEQMRFLRRLRNHLTSDSILVLAVPNALPVAQQPVCMEEVLIAGSPCCLRREYDPIDGQVTESLQVISPGQAVRSLKRLRRLYTPAELISLARRAGYRVVSLDGDFATGQAAGSASRSLQLVARPERTPPFTLAVTHWRTPPEHHLELRYAPDETAWVHPSPDEIWERTIAAEAGHGAEAAGFYPVDDPYGAERAAGVVSAYFGCPIPDRLLTFGAGVTPLLRDLSGLADGGRILCARLGHPDLPAWAMSTGSQVQLLESPSLPDQLQREIVATRPGLVHLDRPTILGELLSKDELMATAEVAARVGALVLVDESAASYFGPAASVVPLVHRLDNLVVLRSFTKAYSRGGIRVGLAIASESLAPRIRELVSPLQVGELSYRAALRLLEAGDMFARLRARIAETKPMMVLLLEALGLDVLPGHPSLPWLIVRDESGRASRFLECHGIRGLRLVPSPVRPEERPDLLQLFIPLSEERMRDLERRLAMSPGVEAR